MDAPAYRETLRGTVAETYQRFFVPAIGAPVAADLMAAACLRPGEHVLDVGCGTGVVTRLAAERVGPAGRVAGLDVNPGMLEVARSQTPPDIPIEWYQATAESMPLPDAGVDVVLCQMALQFVPDRPAASREMRRVLKDGGRAIVVLPGPKPPLFAVMTDALARHLGPETASFADLVFSLHDPGEIAGLMRGAGFRQVEVGATTRTLRLPAPRDFLWQYVESTPMAEAAERAGAEIRDALERDVCAGWQAFVAGGSLSLEVGLTTAVATA